MVVWRDLQRPTPEEGAAGSHLDRLLVVSPGATPYQPGQAFPLRRTATLGRAPDNSIVLPDDFVSTNHAALFHRDGRWWLADLHSRNGTSVNGSRVTTEVPLQDGDMLAVGGVILKLDQRAGG